MRFDRNAARGRWYDILTRMGIPAEFLKNKHGPCPMCGGHDRFRWDDKDGHGTYFCSGCGAGDGVNLICSYKGIDFQQFKDEVRPILGDAKERRVRPMNDELKNRRARRSLWNSSHPIQSGDLVERYLVARLGRTFTSSELRTYDHPGGAIMVARALSSDGSYCETLHRTLLASNGEKIDRLLMRGKTEPGYAVRLMPASGDVLGIAEGIETAISAAILFDVPVWAALNAGNLARWKPPEKIKHLFVFGDKDLSYTGQAAAYRCARINTKQAQRKVEVHFPPDWDADWNDYHCKQREPATIAA
jgi:putative DNA primase/helicase